MTKSTDAALLTLASSPWMDSTRKGLQNSLSGTAPYVSSLCLPDITTLDKISQAFPPPYLHTISKRAIGTYMVCFMHFSFQPIFHKPSIRSPTHFCLAAANSSLTLKLGPPISLISLELYQCLLHLIWESHPLFLWILPLSLGTTTQVMIIG